MITGLASNTAATHKPPTFRCTTQVILRGSIPRAALMRNAGSPARNKMPILLAMQHLIRCNVVKYCYSIQTGIEADLVLSPLLFELLLWVEIPRSDCGDRRPFLAIRVHMDNVDYSAQRPRTHGKYH